jgi:outer membrane protein assembly factor BamB
VHRSRTTISCRLVAQIVALIGIVTAPPVAAAQLSPAPEAVFPSAIVWSIEIPSAPVGPPVIAGGRVVVATQSGRVLARHAADGTEDWTAQLAVKTELTAADDLLIVPIEGAIDALDLKTGQRRWSAETGILTAPPLFKGGWLILAAGEELTALSAADGDLIWTKKIALIEYRPAIEGKLLYVSVADGRVVALDLESGSLQWERPVGSNPTEPFAYGDRVYVGASGRSLVCLNAANGVEEWVLSIGAAVRGRVDADASRIYVASMDNLLRALRRSHGAKEWQQDLGYRPTSGPIVVGSTVAVPGRSAAISAFHTSRHTVVTQLKLPDPPVVPPGVVLPPAAPPALAIVSGDPGKPWMLSLTGPPPPSIPAVSALSVLPGEVLPAMTLPGQ